MIVIPFMNAAPFYFDPFLNCGAIWVFFLLLKWLNNQNVTENIYDLIQIKTKRYSSHREIASVEVTFGFELRI